ncbi:MAG: adenylate/guanylate cyclase domain-containing protein, partial [Desulforhopalus sp.]
MVREDYKRKLTAILHADVQGYSRLMGEDEEATVSSLAVCIELISGLIVMHRGRVVSGAGDSLLAEFISVVDAVRCAVKIQKELKSESAKHREDNRVLFRIGINLGDVIEKDGDLLGDGVNLAARVEALADGGGICITRSVYDQVKKKLKLGYEYLGEHTVKNIAEPVRVYRVQVDSNPTVKLTRGQGIEPRRQKLLFTTVIVLLLSTGLVIWKYLLPSSEPQIEVATVSKMALPLPDKPSLAVLPFVNMSDDPNQEYFSDGITEDLITDLSKISGLFVIARNSTFTYKGQSVKVQQVSEDLGVRYVLEGSVRKSGEKVRINAQLIDALTGHHLWADRFDGQHGDIFTLQDTFTRKIVAALSVELTNDDKSLLARKDTANVEAHDAYMQGWEFMRRESPEDLEKAVASFKKAIELDPEFSRGYTALSHAYTHAMTTGWDVELGWFDAGSQAQQYLNIVSKNPTPHVHREASGKHLYKREFQEAITEAELALALSPNDPESNWALGRALVSSGLSVEGMEYLKQAMRLNPSYPGRYALHLGIVKYLRRNYEEALVLLEEAEKLEPSEASVYCSNSWFAATYAQLGRDEEAAAVVEKNFWARGWQYGVSVESCFPFWPLKDPEDLEHYADGLVKSGYPVPMNPVYRGRYEEALIKVEKLLEADPNDPVNLSMMIDILIFTGKSTEAIGLIKKGKMLTQRSSLIFMYQLGLAQFCNDQYENAVENLETYFLRQPYSNARMWILAAAYAHMDQLEEA